MLRRMSSNQQLTWLRNRKEQDGKYPSLRDLGPDGVFDVVYVTTDGERLCADCVNDPTNPVTFGLKDPTIEQKQWNVVGYEDAYDGAPEEEDWVCAHCSKVVVECGATLQRKAEETAEEDEVPSEPDEGDYVMSPSGPLGSKVAVSIVGGSWLGEFPDRDEAEHAIRRKRVADDFWPNVWTLSDHGNLELVTLSEEEEETPKLELRWFSGSYRGGEVLAFVKAYSEGEARATFLQGSPRIVYVAQPSEFNTSMWDEFIDEGGPVSDDVSVLEQALRNVNQ